MAAQEKKDAEQRKREKLRKTVIEDGKVAARRAAQGLGGRKVVGPVSADETKHVMSGDESRLAARLDSSFPPLKETMKDASILSPRAPSNPKGTRKRNSVDPGYLKWAQALEARRTVVEV